MAYLAVLVLAAILTNGMSAEDHPLLFRHVFVPLDQLNSLPRDGDKYVPVESNDLQTLIDHVNSATAEAVSGNARVRRAEYHARWNDDRLVDGVALLDIDVEEARESLLSLGDISTSIDLPHWESSGPARIGTWGRSGVAGVRVGVMVPKPDRLTFGWQATATEGIGGTTLFLLRLPAALETRFVLTLPGNKLPSLTDGVTLEKSESGDAFVWTLAAPPRHLHELRIEDSSPNRSHVVTKGQFREMVSYQLNDRGMRVSASLEVINVADAPAQLTFPIDPRLQLESISTSEAELTWEIGTDPDQSGPHVNVSLPEAFYSRHGTVVVQGWTALELNDLWTLPRIRARELQWVAGAFELHVPDTFELVDIQPPEPATFVRTNFAALDTSPIGSCYTFMQLLPTAELQIEARRRSPRIGADIETNVEMGRSECSASSHIVLETESKTYPTLQGELLEGWHVESVTGAQPSDIQEWHVESKDGKKWLVVRLNQSNATPAPLEVRVGGRRSQYGSLQSTAISALRMVSWQGVDVGNEMLLLQPKPGLRLHIRHEGIDAVRNEPPPSDSPMQDVSAQTVIDLQSPQANGTISITPIETILAADVDIVARVHRRRIDTRYRFTCDADGSGANPIRICFQKPLLGELRWSSPVSDKPLAAERLPARAETDTPRLAEFSVWQIPISASPDEPIVIDAVLAGAPQDLRVVPLAFLSGANRQLGRVVIGAATDANVVVEQRGLDAIVPPTDSLLDSDMAISAYRFEPSRLSTSAASSSLAIRTLTPSIDSGSTHYVHRAELTTFYAGHGSALHDVILHVTHRVDNELVLQLPSGTRLEYAHLDGNRLESELADDKDASAVLRVPRDHAQQTISLRLSQPIDASLLSPNFSPPLPTGTMEILGGRWTIWLPQNLIAIGGRSAQSNNAGRARLVPGRVKSHSQRPFMPWTPNDWSNLWPVPLHASDSAGTAIEFTNTSESQVGVSSWEMQGGISHGWHSQQFEFGNVGLQPVHLARVSRPAAWAWAAFFCTVALAVGTKRNRLFVLATGVGITALLSLIFPVPFQSIASGSFLGSFVGLFARFWEPSGGAEDSARTARSATTLTAMVATAFGLFMVGDGHRTQADELSTSFTLVVDAANTHDSTASFSTIDDSAAPSNKDSPGNPQIHQIMIPINKGRLPEGTKKYVSESFYKELLHRVQRLTPLAGDWLIRSATYSGSVSNESVLSVRNPTSLEATTWRAEFEIEVFTSNATVRFPFTRDQARWNPQALLDGLPLRIDWNAAGDACTVTVDEPGVYRLQFSFVPQPAEQVSQANFYLTIPKVTNSRLTVSLPSNTFPLEISTGKDRLCAERSANSCDVTLGCVDHFRVGWPLENRAKATRSALELLWLHITPTGCWLEAKFELPAKPSRVEELRLAADPHLDLVQVPAEIDVEKLLAPDGRRRMIHLRPTSGHHLDSIGPLQFKMIENLPYVRFDTASLVAEAPIAGRRMLAISCDETMTYEVSPVPGTSPASIREFQATWRDNSVRPQRVVNLDADMRALVLVQPRQSAPTVDEMLSVVAGRDSIALKYDADVVPRYVDQFQLRLNLSNGMEVDDVQITVDGEADDARWRRNSNGQLVIFFGQVLDRPFHVAVTAYVPTPHNGRIALPRINIVGVPEQRQQIFLYRRSDTLAELDAAELEDQPRSLPAALPAGVRAVGVYRGSSEPERKRTLRVTPNLIEVVGESLTTVWREDQNWMASWACRLRVEQGVLDVIRLDLPPDWLGPFQLRPKLLLDLGGPTAVASGQPVTRSHVTATIRLPEALRPGDPYTFELQGPLTGSELKVPAVRAEHTLLTGRYIAVPSEIDGAPVNWTRVGIDWASRPPQQLQPVQFLRGPSQLFQVTDDPYLMTLQSSAPSYPVASYVDVHIWEDANAGQFVDTAFVFRANRHSEFELVLPVEQKLVDVFLGTNRPMVRRLADQRWIVPVISGDLPQVLRVISMGPTKKPDRKRPPVLSRPRLQAAGRDVPAQHSLWSLASPRGRFVPTNDSSKSASAPEHALLRLTKLLTDAESAREVVSELPQPEQIAWGAVWNRHLQDALATAERAVSGANLQSESGQIASENLPHETLSELVERVSAWQTSVQIEGKAASNNQTDDVQFARLLFDNRHDKSSQFIADGTVTELPLSRSDVGDLDTNRTMILLTILAAATILAGWLSRKAHLGDLFWQYPGLIGVFSGLFYWAWLIPSALGCAIVIVSLIQQRNRSWHWGSSTVNLASARMSPHTQVAP